MGTMAEALVKNPYCSKCGEDARPQAQFCFACGGAVVFPETQESEEVVSSEWFKGDIVDSDSPNDSDVENSENLSGSLKAIPMPATPTGEVESVEAETIKEETNIEEEPEIETVVGKQTSDVTEDEQPELETKVKVKAKKLPAISDESNDLDSSGGKLRSASDLRKKPKPTRMKRVEVVWDENETSPNWLFIVLGLIMLLLAAIVIYAAFVLK